MQSLIIAVVLALASGIVRLLKVGHRPKNYPPGPPTLPILGNIHQMPSRDAHLQFEKWAKEYGPVYSLILGTKTLVVLSSPEAVKDLLDRRSGIYSSRQDMYIGQTLCSGGLRLLMMPYGPTWRMYRKMFHSLLNISAARSYVPYQMLENKQMLYQMLSQPNDVLKHIRRYSNALTTSMVFGWRTSTYEDPKMQQLFSEFAKFSDLNQTGTAALVDFFPLLRYLPNILNSTQKKAQEHHQREKKLYMEHWLKAKSAIADGTIKPCFCVGMAEAQKASHFSDEQACYTSGTLLEAGSDTTSSTLYGFVQAMVLYPEAQKLGQDEIDRVVGPDRLPTMEDEANLQYIRQCMKEALRWMPTTILGAVPHAVTQDDEYMGYLIPKGAGVMNNVWGIHRDPERYPEPQKFDPSRYDNDGQSFGDSAANPDPRKRDQFTFGAGRRICPGIHVAERSLFLGISRILWAFNIEPAQDENGRPIYPDQDRLTQGFVCAPEPFPVRIIPRSQARADLVTKDWKEAEAELLDDESKQWRKSPVESISFSSTTK